MSVEPRLIKDSFRWLHILQSLIYKIILICDNRFNAEIHAYKNAKIGQSQDKDVLSSFLDNCTKNKRCQFSIIFGTFMKLVDFFEKFYL